MTDYKMRCLICEEQQTVHAYSDFQCDGCGQQYHYDEGHRIVLTDSQLAVLRGIKTRPDEVI